MTPMSCTFCETAVHNPETGRHDTACRGCRVRLASMAPRHAREVMVGEEIARGDLAFQADVVGEFNRRQAAFRSGRIQGESR